jgi:hypothetical protein
MADLFLTGFQFWFLKRAQHITPLILDPPERSFSPGSSFAADMPNSTRRKKPKKEPAFFSDLHGLIA